MGLAALIPISVMIGYAIGHYLDLWQSTTYFTPIFLILGAVAGLVGPRSKSDKRSHRWGSL